MRRVNTLLRRIALPFGFAVALAALLLMVSPASAQEPPEAESGARLHPGINLIGWVGEPTPVAQPFREIPQLEAIWAWDAELDDWIVAARNAPEWLGGLGRVTAGMGLRMQLGGDAPVIWDRSTEPTRGLVKLRTGWNLVAWSGADGAAIDDVAKGIGWSLRSVRRWDAVTQQWATWTSPERSAQVIADTSGGEEAEFPGVRRGEALWVKVSRSVNWLQPTDILPRLVFPGGASQSLQARVREDLEAVLSYYRDQYGIQADPDFTVYVAKDADALIQAYKDDGVVVDDAYEAAERALWNRAGGWAGRGIVVKQSSWPEDLSNSETSWARYTLTHEYFHVLQSQLSDGGAATWLVEGTASWGDGEHRVTDDQQTWEEQREGSQSEITNSTPTLRSTESDNAGWEYALGWLATDLLTADTGTDSWIAFWRHLASTEIGPHGRWTSSPDWRTAFQAVFGMPVADFYVRFDSWQREQAQRNSATTTDSDDDARWIRGRITREGVAPVAGVFVNAIRVEGETGVGWNQRAETDAAGAFAVRALQDGDYRLSVDINDDCTRYYSDGELTDEWKKAQIIRVAAADVPDVNIPLTRNACGWRIRGQVVTTDSQPLRGIRMTACPIGGGTCASRVYTDLDGSFAIAPDSSRAYRLRLDLVDGCSAYYESAGLTFDQQDASPLTAGNADVGGLTIQVPFDLCDRRMALALEGIDRFLTSNIYVRLCQIVSDQCESTTRKRVDHGGAITVPVPVDGTYRLFYDFDGCSVHHGPHGLVSGVADAALITVDGSDVRVGYLRIPNDVCAHQIKGSITTSNGQPLADTYIWACREVNDECVDSTGRWTDSTGMFAITVPTEGRYRLSFNLEGCTIYFRRGGFTTDWQERSTVRVEGRSVRLDPRQIPAEMCAHQIKGSITTSDGQPLTDTRVSACREVGNDCVDGTGRRIADDGSFAITVPTEGAYRVSFNLEGCTIYFRRGGFTTDWQDRSTVRVEGRSVRLNPRQIPAEMCAHRISGRFVDAASAAVADKWMNVCNATQCGGIHTAADGGFTIRVPSGGFYTFDIWLTNDCNHRLGGRSLGGPSRPIRVSGADVTGVVLRLPDTIENLCE